MKSNPNGPLHLHNLAGGSTYTIPRALFDPKLHFAIKQAVETSISNNELTQIQGLPYGVLVNDTCPKHATACFEIAATTDLENKKIKELTTLCGAAVACRLKTAPHVWRVIAGYYLQCAATAPVGLGVASLPPMPHTMPWSCYHMFPPAGRLNPQLRQSLLHVVEQISLFLTEECLAMASLPKPLEDEISWEDWQAFPELRHWDD